MSAPFNTDPSQILLRSKQYQFDDLTTSFFIRHLSRAAYSPIRWTITTRIFRRGQTAFFFSRKKLRFYLRVYSNPTRHSSPWTMIFQKRSHPLLTLSSKNGRGYFPLVFIVNSFLFCDLFFYSLSFLFYNYFYLIMFCVYVCLCARWNIYFLHWHLVRLPYSFWIRHPIVPGRAL